MNNIYVLNKNYRQIGVLSNQGANPQAPYYDDLYIQELDTGADTYQFSTMSTSYTQDLLEIGNHIMFTYNNRNELFTITSLEYSHYEGYKTIGVYAEGIGFELLDVFMERPELPEEDEEEEGNKKYPNNIYIDENGNIIYDPEGNYEEDEDKITIDENGNIIYNPSTNKKKNNDSLEFKNISYPRFLSTLLKNTGWSYVCQPGLESVKHDISVRYDTNIYAILQDSMQAYRGVELEFVHEMQNGRVKKIIKAYKDGGRGSFVGKRFEYGTNVRGITKTQEVTNNEDDTIIRIDNVGVDIYYDIDFALKSAEIPEIEIGDTHYVIDRQFCPPMTIKARIGKIEISFSDPTKNKITVANTKKIRGAAVDEEDIKSTVKNLDDIINDGIDDYNDIYGDDDIISGDYIKNHDPMAYLGNLQIDEWLEVGGFDAPGGDAVGIRLTNNMGETTLLPDRIKAKNIEVEEDIQSRLIHVDENLDAVRIRVYGDNPITGGLHIFGQGGLHVNNFIQFADGSRLTSANGLNGGGSNPDSGGDSGDDGGDSGTSNPEFNDITCRLVEAKQVSTEKLIIEREDGESAKADIYGELYVTEKIKCESTTETNTLDVNTIKFADGTTMTTAGSSSDGGDLGIPDGVIEYMPTGGGHMFQEPYIKVNTEMQAEHLIVRGDFIITGEHSEGMGGLIVPGLSADEGYIGDFSCKTINGYTVENLLSATSTASVESLQEEVRMRDEQIASLEARLAAIEEMLNNK